MKHRISISIDEKTLVKIRAKIRKLPRFRNKSHFFELAAHKIMEEDNE